MRRQKMSQKELARLRVLFDDYARSKGASLGEYGWEFPTPAGTLYARLPEDILFCRFGEPERAAKLLGEFTVSQISGKYNSYILEKLTAEAAFEKYIRMHIDFVFWKASH